MKNLLNNKDFKWVACFLFIMELCFILVPYKVINPDLEWYYARYYREVEKVCGPNRFTKPQQVSIDFGTLNSPTIGVCYLGLTKYRIQIDSAWWTNASADERYGVMMHELTHCTTWDRHTETPNHFMNAWMPNLSTGEITTQMQLYFKEKCKK